MRGHGIPWYPGILEDEDVDVSGLDGLEKPKAKERVDVFENPCRFLPSTVSSHPKAVGKMSFPFPKVGYISSPGASLDGCGSLGEFLGHFIESIEGLHPPTCNIDKANSK